jgi:hypothetical protein
LQKPLIAFEMAKKKEWFSQDVHPNVGMSVTLLLRDKDSNKSVCKKGMWNRTHWALRKNSAGDIVSIPSNMEILGWSE